MTTRGISVRKSGLTRCGVVWYNGAMVIDWKQEIREFAKALAGALLFSFGWLVAVNGQYWVGIVMMAAGLTIIIKG